MQQLLEGQSEAIAGNAEQLAEVLSLLKMQHASSGGGGAAAASAPASERWVMEAKAVKFDLEEDDDGLLAKVKLGSGSFGTVYSGSYHGTKVAVKEMEVTVPADVAAFKKEAMLTFRLHHPNVVHCYGGTVLKKAVRIVIEMMRTSLAEELHVKQTALTEPQRREVILHVARGLSYLHARGVAHRDLKPGNVMQDEFGRYWKLIDFGMATAKGSSKKSMRTTKAGSNEGTQGYMAPELYSRAGGTHKVDAFAFGVTIWELYAKTRPFEGVAEAAIGREVEKGARPPLAAVGELDVRELVAACWHQTPEARPEMADVVGGIEQGGGA